MNHLIEASGMSRQAVTMSSIDLLDLVNRARIEFGESQVRHADFAARCRDELDGENYETFVVTNKRGPATIALKMSADQCKLVAMRESKAVRRSVLARLKELESRQHVTLPSYAETLRLYADQIEETQRVTAERDIAIATKALIGSRREATAMAKASAAARKVRKLEAELGFNTEHATVVAVERATGRKFPRNTYVNLRRWCRLNDVQPANVADPRYGFVKAWPAGAWLEHEGVDLKKLFSRESV